MNEFKPSRYQQVIFDFVENGRGNGIIQATAGSGKTVSVVEATKFIPANKNVLFLAFNKSIAMELQRRVPSHVEARTLNSLGHRAWMRYVDRQIKLDANKTWNIINDTIAPLYDAKLIERLGPSIKKLVSLGKACGIAPSDSGLISLEDDTVETWQNLIDYHDITIDDRDEKDSSKDDIDTLIEITRQVLKVSVKQQDVIDFDDQLYMTVIYDAPLFRFDWVFVDECQDLNAVQRQLLSKALKSNGRLLAVGDSRQSIYSFRGADTHSMDRIAKLFNCRSFPLTISYRCPKAVVREAQKLAPEIEAAENAIEGEIVDFGLFRHDIFRPKDLVICRNTAPLVKGAYSLIGKRVAATILGRDLGQGLVTLIKKLKARTLTGLVEKLVEWRDREVRRKQIRQGKDADISGIEDKFEVINVFIDMSGAETVGQLISAIENIFSNGSDNAVVFATAHKSKGLEADRVFILDKWRMPSRYARKPHQQEQERNIEFVAITRAKKLLGYVEFPRER